MWAARFLLPTLVIALASGVGTSASPTATPGVDDGTPPMVVSRHYHGDLFTFKQQPDVCGASFCYEWGGLGAVPLDGMPCRCRCDPPYPTYREDIGACVNDVQECHLADFSMGDTQEKIPFVFMPERGQLVHPSAEITMSALTPEEAAPVVSPVCVVSGSEVISRSGWLAINSTFEPPFRLNRDNGKTFLQWVGEGVSESAITGRVVLVRLLCKDAGNPLQPRFSPCLAFRVAGTQGQAEPVVGDEEGGAGSLAVGLSIGAVLLLYLLAMAGYLVYRRRRRRAGHQLIEDALMGKQARRDTAASERQSRRSRKDGKNGAEESSELPARPGSSLSHGSGGSGEVNERLPEEPLGALVEEDGDAAALEDDDDMGGHNSTLRRRLYFNPAFFDPDLLHDPPPGAIEFLVKIREMITIAKLKMQAKQYVPTLQPIAETEEEVSPVAVAEDPSSEQPVTASSPRQSSVDIDRWLETVVRESASDSEPPYAERSLSRAQQRTKKTKASAAAGAAAVVAAVGPITSWRQQARRIAGRDESDSDTLVEDNENVQKQAIANASNPNADAAFDSDDTLNDLVSEAESKVPKLYSDEDSEVYSELPVAARAKVSAKQPRSRTHIQQRKVKEEGLYEEIHMSSDKSLSTFSGEYTSVSINGDGSVIRTGGKMTIEVDSTAAADAQPSDAESEEVFDPDTLEKRRIRVRKARKVRRKPSFYDDSLERRKRGVNYEEKFETTHINVLNTSAESGESVYRRWGSVVSASDNSVYSHINFVSGKTSETRGLVVGNLRHSQRNLKTFKDYSPVKFEGQTSLLDQWKKKNEPRRSDSTLSNAPTLPLASPLPASPIPGTPPNTAGTHSHPDRISRVLHDREPTPPIPPKTAHSPSPVMNSSSLADAPPLPPRTHSPQRERSLVKPPAPSSPTSTTDRSSPVLPPRPKRGSAPQPPLPPKSAASPPPLPSKTRPAPTAPASTPTTRRYFLGQIDGSPDPAAPRRRRQNSAGESETNSTSSASTQADESGSSGSGGGAPGSGTLGRQVEARLERHMQRSYSASDVSRSDVESLAGSRCSLRSAARCPPNVLERISECESAIRRGAGAGTGMAIALSLRERQEAERVTGAGVRTKWRRLVDAPAGTAAPHTVREDSGYQSTDSADSHRPPAAGALSAAAIGGDSANMTPTGIRRLMQKFDESTAEPASPSRTRWVHVQ